MGYARIVNGQVTQIGLPTTGTLKDGSSVSGYNLLDESVLNAEGWLPLVDNPPAYNADTEYLEHAGYTIGETEVLANYIVKQIVPTIAVPTTAERLAAIEEALLMLI